MLSKLLTGLRLRAAVRPACPRPTTILKTAAVAGAVALAALASPGATARPGPSPVVETQEGPVQGVATEGVTQFLGIPYAEPPVGELRWRPPVDHRHWAKVLQATQFAPICALSTTLGVFSGPANNNEDCLFLNVFTPSLDPGAKLPVIVWIHGGGNVDGETPGYDGSKLALKGGTVVVTLAYRLNLMGFLAHPALDAEGHLAGNYGLLDQQAVLRWVQRNIHKFGGDKDNVTLGGQSAGAEDTGLNMLSPLAAGLFHRGICESFCPTGTMMATRAQAEATGTAFAVAAGCGSGTGPDVAQCLRSLPAAQVEALAGTASAQSQFVTGPLVDGEIIPDQPGTLWANGHFNHMPLMNGNVADEQNFTLAITEFFTSTSNALRTPATPQDYMNFVSVFGAAAPQIMATYPLSGFATPQLALDRIGTDTGICAQRRLDKVLAPQIPVYAYEFDDVTAPFYFPQMPGFQSLAYHTSDIQYLFPGWHGGPDGIQLPLNPQQTVLSDRLVAAWTSFARTGDPNGHGNAPWPLFTAGNGPAWLLENISALSTLTDAQYDALRHCDLWDSLAAPNN